MRRFSIAGMLCWICALALVFAAFARPSDLLSGLVLGFTLLWLGIGLLGALDARGSGRAYWRGFFLFGMTYLVMCRAPWLSENLGRKLPTTQLVEFCEERISAWEDARSAPEAERAWAAIEKLARDRAEANQTTRDEELSRAVDEYTRLIDKDQASEESIWSFWSQQTSRFDGDRLWVGQCFFAILFGQVGGMISRRFQADPAPTGLGQDRS